VDDAVVEWGPEAYPTVRNQAPATSSKFEEKSELKLVQYVHRAVIRPLASGARYGECAKMTVNAWLLTGARTVAANVVT
jgi:hypothetical protein